MGAIKTKPWLDSVFRKPNTKIPRHNNCIRLDKQERVGRFDEKFFNEFLMSLTQEDFIAYPETNWLIDRLCRHHKVKEGNVFLTPGTDAAIKAFFEISIMPGDEVLLTKPCFPMYSVYTALFNAKPVEISYNPDLTFDFDGLLNSVTEKTSLVVLANPNSPIGNYLEIDQVERLAARANHYGVPMLVDEAYYEFSPGTCIDLTGRYENLGVARTFSKAFGGGGIRIGYVIGSEELIGKLSKWRLMYEVNQIGVKFAIYMLDHIEEVLDYAKETNKERKLLAKMLKDAGFEVVCYEGNWIHFQGEEYNSRVGEILHKHNVLFNPQARLPHDNRDWLRITIGPGLSREPYIKEILELKESK